MTPEARLLKSALAFARVHGLPEQEVEEETLKADALAYSKAIHYEECARIVDEYVERLVKMGVPGAHGSIADAIREEGAKQ